MTEATKRWIEFAKEDLKAAEALITAPASFRSYQLSVIHCHQGVEKMLKAILVEKGIEVKKIHNLITIMIDTGVEFPEHLRVYITKLNPHFVASRYPDLPSRGQSFHYDEEVAKFHLEKTKELFVWIEQQLTHI